MRNFIRLFSAVALLGAAAAIPAQAQDGFALKGHLIFNSADAEAGVDSETIPDANGFNIGAEYVLPILNIGVGVSGYTTGSAGNFDVGSSSLLMLAEVNYFLDFPLIPVVPYAGLHTGLGAWNLGDVQEGRELETDFSDVGFQVGVRVAIPFLPVGLDAQYRRVSGSLSGQQDAGFDQNQVLVGVTVF